MSDIVTIEAITGKIHLIRGMKVMLDADLAELYGVTTKALNQAVTRNEQRFPPDFMFRLTKEKKQELVTNCDRLDRLKHSSALPRVFILGKCHVIRYESVVIKTFADKHTWDFFATGKSKRLQPDLLRRSMRRLEYIDLATCLGDLNVPPSNRLQALRGKRAG